MKQTIHRLSGLVLAAALTAQLAAPARAAEPFGGQIAVPEQLYSGESAMLTLNTGDDFTGTKRVTLTADNAPDCVDEGLVLHWDGVCNTKSGHDAAATVWEDLSGNGADLALSELSGDNYWTGEGFHLKNTAYSTPQCLQDTINGSAFTLEMVVDDYILYGNSFGTLLSSENDSFSVFHRASNGIWEFKNGNNQNRPKLNDVAALLQGSTVSIVFTAGAESTVYVNGEAAASWTPAGAIGASGWMRLGHDDDTRKFEAVFRSVRLYDRALSQEEVQANYACDALERSGSLDASFQEQASGTALDLFFENGSAQVPFSLTGQGSCTITAAWDGGSCSAALTLRSREAEAAADAEAARTAADLLRYNLLAADEGQDQQAAAAAAELLAGSDFLARGGHVNAAWDGESGRYDLTLTLNAALQTLSITPNRVVYTQTFDGVAEGQLPQGWSLTAAGSVDASVTGGALRLGADGDDSGTSRLLTPVTAGSGENVDFIFEADLRFAGASQAGRWAGLMFGYQNAGSWWQTISRISASSGGVELAQWSSGWNVVSTGSFTQDFDPDTVYTFRTECARGVVRQYINDVLILTTPFSGLSAGRFGFSDRGVELYIDNVSLQVTPGTQGRANYQADLYAPDTAITSPAAVVYDAGNDALAVAAAEKRPSSIIVYPDSALRVYDRSGALLSDSLDAYLEQTGDTTLPVLFLSDAPAAQAVKDWITAQNLMDVSVLADCANAALVEEIAAACTGVRGAIRYTFQDLDADGDGSLTGKELWRAASLTNASHAKIALLDAQSASLEHIRFLQRRLITVWAETPADPRAVYSMVTAGPNGIVTTAPGAVIAAMESLDEGIIMARPTYITGHRGQPGDTTENTLSSAKHAYVSGANAIENDVYLTTDGVLVIDHDGTTGRLYNQNLTVERCTWAELQALSFKNPVNLEDGEGMATLEQFFTEFKGKDVVHFIEIKSSQTAIVAAVKALAEQLDVVEQCVVITFNANIRDEMARTWPEMSCGYLTGFSDQGSANANIQSVALSVWKDNNTFNPSYGGGSAAFVQAMRDAEYRGITFWPWTVRDQGLMDTYMKQGINGDTTDYSMWASKYALCVTQSDLSAKAGSRVALSPVVTTQDGTVLAAPVVELKVLSGTAPVQNEDGTYTLAAGETLALLRYTCPFNSGGSYDVYSNAFTLTGTTQDGGHDGGDGAASSGSAELSRYPVSIPSNVTGGLVTVRPKRAAMGDKVTLTVTPGEGYALDQLSAAAQNGRALSLSDAGGGRYTFTMPAGAVTVSVSFVPTGETPAPVPAPSFADVPSGAWYGQAVSGVWARGLMQGTSGGAFSPSLPMTRAMLWTVLARLDGQSFSGGEPWYAAARLWAMENAVSDGTNPDGPITREQLAAMLFRYAGSHGQNTAARAGLETFADGGAVSTFAEASVMWAVSSGILTGKPGNTLDPQGTATRAEVAVLLMRFLAPQA